ncbi:chromosome segregation protein SMC [Herbaspirillum lusitanum]|uniref:AAA family ATPase n=1 Tax=Herbaspirillum lusitanum TaxID=213312 RepID=UPI002237206D|nr:AAA family ATPase [Herbaspirillum lusitanum]MCW5300540.1 chromosome segregation protein SMC [Herbaspirillum lusitanum]
MADAPYFLQALHLTGFRAYLQPKTFNFSKQRCLAIFAPNGSGKSSFVDALEFLFSEEGTLERLGLRAINNNAGVTALAHNLAEGTKIAPAVSVDIVSGKTITSGSRTALGANRPMPPAVAAMKKCFTVLPIIRGHALRTFVENHQPERRYTDVATWLQLGPLVEVQKNIRALRTQVKLAAEDMTSLQRVDTQLSKETFQALKNWDTAAVQAHANTNILAPLDKTLALAELKVADPAYIALVTRATAEEKQVGLAGLRQMRNAAVALWSTEIDVDGEPHIKGTIVEFEAAVMALATATTREEEERGKAANSVFEALWNAAEPVFAEGATIPQVCPVCITPIENTTAGSAEAIRGHIVKHLDELADYANAKKTLTASQAKIKQAHTNLVASLPGLIGLLADETALKVALVAYQAAIVAWREGVSPSSIDIVSAIPTLLTELGQAIADIEAKQGDHTYAKAKIKIDNLFGLDAEYGLALRTQKELEVLSENLTAQATMISGEIRKKVQALLNMLQTPMNDIYRQIQGAEAAPIRLELPSEDDTNQQRLHLVIDFAKNRTGVQPGGYLSDSQIHSIALALQLAAIKQFNAAAPVIALDDIVTSYDADHRRAIAALIATTFGNSQILITTHDERFFNYLKDQLEAKTWQFTRIIGLDPTFGPRFADHKVSDEMIMERWESGHSAANEMRQAEEEWLLGICRDFGVSLRIRPLEKAYSFERSELASALAELLKDTKLEPALIPGVKNRFLTSLQKGEIENFGSHFQDAPYGDGSIGDEKARWAEFQAFKMQFACPKCSRAKFQRPFTLKKPVCAHNGCEAQFEFKQAMPAAGTV